MEKNPIDEIRNDSVNFDWNAMSVFVLKSDAAQRVILRNQARIIAKLEQLDADKLEDQFEKEVQEEIVETFKTLKENQQQGQ